MTNCRAYIENENILNLPRVELFTLQKNPLQSSLLPFSPAQSAATFKMAAAVTGSTIGSCAELPLLICSGQVARAR